MSPRACSPRGRKLRRRSCASDGARADAFSDTIARVEHASAPQRGCSSGVSSEQIGRLYGIADRDLAAFDHLGIDSAIAVVESALQRRGNLQITDAG